LVDALCPIGITGDDDNDDDDDLYFITTPQYTHTLGIRI
jgi:hypothetical protein